MAHVGFYDSHTFASSGTYELPCGEAKFQIRNPSSAGTGPKCGSNDFSPIPNKVWNSDAGNIYNNFCSAVKNGEDLRMMVDTEGNEIGSRKRSPPPNPGLYKDYGIELIWEAGTGAAAEMKCDKSCEDAMQVFASSSCGHKGGKFPFQPFHTLPRLMRRVVGQTMYMPNYATYDVGCGTYSYRIHHAQPIALQKQECFRREEFGPHKDVGEDWVKMYAKYMCLGSANRNIRRGAKDTWAAFRTETNGIRYDMSAKWDQSCELLGGAEEVLLANPVGNAKYNCLSLTEGNYYNCNNGGIGGHIQAGCVVFEFKASPA